MPKRKDESSSDDESSSSDEPTVKEEPESSEDSSSEEESEEVETPEDDGDTFKNAIHVPGMKPMKLRQVLLTAEELNSKDNEIWIVTAPKSMDARKLQDLTLSLTKPTKFKISNEGYETSVHANPDQAAFLLPNRQNEIVLSSRVIAGTITIQTDVTADQKEANISPIHKKKTMELPPNLKRRHPVYGRDLSELPSKLKKMAKKQSSKSSQDEPSVTPSVTPSAKKKKKNKTQVEDEGTPLEKKSKKTTLVETPSSSKKKKKIKQEPS